MPDRDLEILAEAQRETLRTLAALTERFRRVEREEEDPERAGERRAGQAPAVAGLERALETTVRVIGELGQATTSNTQAVSGLTRELGGLPGLVARLAGGLGQSGSGLGELLKSGLGLPALGLKIAGLFRGGEEAPAGPAGFNAPPSLAIEVGNPDNILAGFPRVDRGQRGEARAVEPERTVVWQPQVTVNVSAMDSRSFLDHSGDIARAMREAMLNMHPVNDVISEL